MQGQDGENWEPMHRKSKMSRNRDQGRGSVQRQRVPKKSPREDLASWVGEEVVGLVRLLPNGRGSFIAENNQLPSITLFEEEIGGLFSGDRVTIRIDADRRGKLATSKYQELAGLSAEIIVRLQRLPSWLLSGYSESVYFYLN